MTYAEKLRDPRWQKRRLEIMKRDDFMCRNCGDTEKTLNVDHKVYVKGRDPWDYQDDDLQTLCEDCHSRLGAARKRIAEAVGRMTSFEIVQLEAFLENRTVGNEITVIIDEKGFQLGRECFYEMVELYDRYGSRSKHRAVLES